MDLDESVTISTPEGLLLRLELAGLGSRFIAGAVDLIIQGILVLILGLVTSATSAPVGVKGLVLAIGSFVILFLYPILFEVLAAGRTPGKRLSHLRVVRDSGAPIDLPASAIRNLLRLIDGPPLLYLPTIVSIAVTSRNQRPGDIAAGTLVIREQPAARPWAAPAGWIAGAAVPPLDAPSSWDASAVTIQETAAVRRFLERRDTLDWRARRELALRLANGLRPKVTSAPQDLDPERFLEELARVKRMR
jgi:uncharacterized RDD family membrane protein YckC